MGRKAISDEPDEDISFNPSVLSPFIVLSLSRSPLRPTLDRGNRYTESFQSVHPCQERFTYLIKTR